MEEKNHVFYVDKTHFIREWWESGDKVTLITRPRRFGKTLTLSMLEQFFSVEHKGSTLFEQLSIWEDEKYRGLQGTYPVIFLSFSNIKESSYREARRKICRTLQLLYRRYAFLADDGFLNDREREDFERVNPDMEDYEASLAIQQLAGWLYRLHGRKAIILLDEYDTPMQEAYVNGYWDDLSVFMRNLFHATFKGNSFLERGLMTGITRISRESIFSDLNNLKVVTTTSEEYADCFGFTEEEVRMALETYQTQERMEEVRAWYDGFTFGNCRGIYNPWSILNFLDTGKLRAYWANTSSNSLAGSGVSAVESHECIFQRVIELALDLGFVHILRNSIVDIQQGYSILADNGSDKLTERTVDIHLTGYRDALSGQTAVDIARNESELCLECRPALARDSHILAVASVLLNPVL